jgi:DNA gyrase subunit B
MAGFAKNVWVTVRGDNSVTVEDDGRGIPVETHPGLSKEMGREVSTLEGVMTVLKFGGKFNKGVYQTSGGLHGVGVTVVNFLSEWCEVQVSRNGHVWQQEYERGIPIGPVQRIGSTAKRGTQTTFKPDAQIFSVTKFTFDTLHRRLQELAFLNRGVRIHFEDERTNQKETFHYERGIVEFVEHLNRASDALHAEVIYISGEEEGVGYEIAIQYAAEYTENLHSYVNNISTTEGGTHVSGFRAGLTRTLNNYGKKENMFKEKGPIPTGEDFREGLTAVISVRVPEPKFEGQTKTKLGNGEVEGFIQTAVNSGLAKHLEEHPKTGKAIVQAAITAAEAREAARKARELVRGKKGLGGGGLPGKLRDCTSKEVEKCELYLVEGDSAGGSAEGGRLRETQAILPLRGKIINAYKSREDKVLANEEVRAMIQAIGVGIGEEQDLSKLRYHKVVIMSVDADETCFVRDVQGNIRHVKVGPFIDQRLATEDSERWDVLCFDQRTHQTEFKPIRQVIRHPIHEPLFEIRTAYGRKVRVTSSHSIFVHEDGQVRLKRGDEVREGDRIVAPARLPLHGAGAQKLDLLAELFARRDRVTRDIIIWGEDVVERRKHKVRKEHAARPDLISARVTIPAAIGEKLAARRREKGLSQVAVCEAVGISQPCTFYDWEKGRNRPSVEHLSRYINLLGFDRDEIFSQVEIGESRLDRIWSEQYNDSGRNRVRPWIRLSELEAEDLSALENVQLAAEHYSHQRVPRYVPVSEQLMTLLGFFLAEGTCSQRGGVRLAMGANNQSLVEEMQRAFAEVFGAEAVYYPAYNGRAGELRVVHNVVAAAFRLLFGFDKTYSHTKRIPDLVYNVPPQLQLAFLRGYFLGDGTISRNHHIAWVTASPELADGLMYLLLAHGVVASLSVREPSGKATGLIDGKPVITRHRAHTVSVCTANDLAKLELVWRDHPSARRIRERLDRGYASGFNRALEPINGDLVALPVTSVKEVQPTNGMVYDFSVAEHENFICGVGGLCAHNSDADVDGSHIRTLLLCFFYRQMYELIAKGHVYIAQPPLFRVRHKKDVYYVQTEEEMRQQLLDRGLQDAALVTEGGSAMEGERMARLCRTLASMEDSLVALERRGISLRTHAERIDPETGRLPVYHVFHGREERWFTTRQQLDEFLKQHEAHEGEASVADAPGAGESVEPEETAAEALPKIGGNGKVLITELHEVRSINTGLKELQELGFDIQSLIPQERTGQQTAPYALVRGETETPLEDLRSLVSAVRAAGEKGLQVTRFKGLGEMNAEELRDTTLDPQHRTLLKVSMSDVAAADEMFRVLMGDKVEPRREFIEKHALEVKNLDV